MVSEQFDRCHGILLQYVEFLSSAVTPIAYAQLIPPLQDLVHKYHIEPEVAPAIPATLINFIIGCVLGWCYLFMCCSSMWVNTVVFICNPGCFPYIPPSDAAF
jgi:hypothetical protein